MKPVCKEIRELVIEAQSGASLDPHQQRAIQKHLSRCLDCRRFQEEMALIFNELKASPLPYPPDALFEDLKHAVMEAVVPGEAHPENSFRALFERVRRLFPQHPFLAPVASGVLGIFIGIALAVTLAFHSPSPVLSQKTPRLTLSQSSATSPDTPPSSLSSISLNEIEEYAGTDALLNTLESQLSLESPDQWEEQSTESLLSGEPQETG